MKMSRYPISSEEIRNEKLMYNSVNFGPLFRQNNSRKWGPKEKWPQRKIFFTDSSRIGFEEQLSSRERLGKTR